VWAFHPSVQSHTTLPSVSAVFLPFIVYET